MYFAGWTISCVVVPRLADTYGRKLPVIISAWFSVLVCAGLMLSQNLVLTIVLFFFLGCSSSGKSSTTYVYLMELIPARWQPWTSIYMMLGDGMTMILLSVYFRYISKDWIYFQI